MSAHLGGTDAVHEITVQSGIEHAVWDCWEAAPGALVGLAVSTHLVGNNAEVKIRYGDLEGGSFGTQTYHIFNNYLHVEFRVPKNARKALFAEVKLPGHGLQKSSNALRVLPVIEVSNARWSLEEARRGDMLVLSADVRGAPDGTAGRIVIFEYDDDEAHDHITEFSVFVDQNRVEVEWEYEYHEDTDEIPTEEEVEKGYNPPEYFFRVIVGGVSCDSDLLRFKDWIEFVVKDETGEPVAEMSYIIHLADASQLRGTTDQQGRIRRDDMPPGKWWLELVES